MTRRSTAGLVAAATLLLLMQALTACAAGNATSPTATPSPSSPASATATATASPSPTPTAEADAEIPTDCRAIVSDAVLTQLAEQPLNDPAFGPSGPQSDGSLICIWGDPGADTTGLTTTISRMNRGPALDMLNALAADEGFSCYLPDAGTRCEKTWQNDTYPVTDGRTLYWRQGVLIDTRYSNLAPTGYTSSIVEHIFT